MVEKFANKSLVGINPAEESDLLALDEKKNPDDEVDEHPKKAEDIVHDNFAQTCQVLADIYTKQQTVLKELNDVISKLTEENMPARRLIEYKSQEE